MANSSFKAIAVKEMAFTSKETGKPVTLFKTHVVDNEGNVASFNSSIPRVVGETIEFEVQISYKGEIVARPVRQEGKANETKI